MLGKRVLVITDDKDSLHAISGLLRRAEYEVLTAESGREGLRLLHSETPPDLVVLDAWLGDMTGLALLSMGTWGARDTRWPDALRVPVLLLTGDDATLDELGDLDALGIVAVMRKPVDPDELLRAVQSAAPVARPSQLSAAGPIAQENDDDGGQVPGMSTQARRLSDLLTRVSEVLAQGLDTSAQLRDVGRAIVPAFASACVIERVDTDSATSLREVLCTQHESSALDSELRSWARQPQWLAQVLTEVADSGKPRLLDLDSDASLLATGNGTDLATARALGFESVVVVPMIARRRVFGMLTCAARGPRRYGRTHLDVFADLGHRIALALDNAELCASAEQLRRDHDALCHALTSELQAPLSALSMRASQAVERSETARERSLAEAFVQETRALQAQLRALADFAGCAAGQLRLEPREQDLAQLVRAHIEESQHAPSLQIDPELSGLHVRTDPERFKQALDAVLQVAASSSAQSGTARGKVEVTLTQPSGDEAELHLTVRHAGPCLSAEQLASLGQLTPFDAHATGIVSSSQPAFGLRFARALIEAQNGRFWVQTQHNVGNSFHIALPLHAAAVSDITNEPSPNAVILLVDSDLAFRRELQEILSERGYRVETADNGLQAWQYLLAHSPPALILFDLVLPAMDGWELHAAIKSHAALQVVPTVVVSGLDRYRIEATLPDAHGYIEKPIRSAQLFEVVQRHVVSPARPRTLSVRPSSFF